MYKAQGQREGFEAAAKKHLDYLLTNEYIKPKTKEIAVRACFGLLLALDNDHMPPAVIRSLEVEHIQDDITQARIIFGDALDKLENIKQS